MEFKVHVQRAVDLKGSQQKLADAAGCSQQQISFLLNEAGNISAEMALKIEAATEGQITRAQMRPDLFASGEATAP